jgi:hypothetical protein
LHGRRVLNAIARDWMTTPGLDRKIPGKIAVDAIPSQNSILIQQYCAPVLLG